MGENQENFRNYLTELAKISDILENSLTKGCKVKVESEIDEYKFNLLNTNLNNNLKETKCIISIGEVEFIFLKK
jgi:hypothetical protein